MPSIFHLGKATFNIFQRYSVTFKKMYAQLFFPAILHSVVSGQCMKLACKRKRRGIAWKKWMRRKPLLPCEKHLIFRKSSKSCPEWVHRRLTSTKAWSRPTKTRVPLIVTTKMSHRLTHAHNCKDAYVYIRVHRFKWAQKYWRIVFSKNHSS